MKRNREYFGTDGVRGRVGTEPITADFVLHLGWAIGRILASKGHGKVVIGKDTRISGYMLESVLEGGLISTGVDVHLLGPLPTPAIAYLTKALNAQAGIVISASHNPYYDNGIILFSSDGYKLDDALEIAIEAQLKQPMITVDSAELGKAVRVIDAGQRYMEFCKNTVPSDIKLDGLKIVLDCANGATYHIGPHILQEFGAEIIPIDVQPNGLNINLQCGATYPEILRSHVLSEKADLGIAFDGDGDRVIMVDDQTNIIDGDDILYIIVKYYLEQGLMNGGVVGTSMSNLGLENALSQLGLEFVRVPVGDQHVIAELRKRAWLFGGEPSGHIVCSKYSTTGDGIIAALQVLSIMHRTQHSLAELSQGLEKYPQKLINIDSHTTQDPSHLPLIQQAIKQAENQLGNQGRILIRRSGTQSLIRVMVEGQNEHEVDVLATQLAALIQDQLK